MYKNKRVKLGFIGIGLMGRPMVHRLLMADYEVYVWNRSQEKLKEVVSAGAVPCYTAAEVAANANIVLLCLADGDAVTNVVSDSQFLEALSSDKMLIDLSSISPNTTRHIASIVTTSSGAEWVDAPVSGGVSGAEQGTLVIMAGGKESAVEKAKPVLAAISKRVTRMGPIGAGQTTKLCNQIIVGCNIVAIAEAMRLAQASSVDTTLLPDALAGGFADSLPFQIFGRRMASDQETPVSIKIATMHKDLQGALSAGEEFGIDYPLTRRAEELLRSRCDLGDRERCITSLVQSQ